MRDGVEDVVFAYIRFDSGLAAHLHLSWLDPHKERRLTVVGSERMATLDDMALERKLTIYDKGFDPAADTYGEYITRSGAVWSPAVPNDEPLRLECEHFIECLRRRQPAPHRRRRRRPGRAGARGAAGLARRRRRPSRRPAVGADVSRRLSGAAPSELLAGLLLGEGVELGAGVELGGNVVIHAGTRIADAA